MKMVSRVASGSIVFVFICATVAAMWFGLSGDQVREGAPIFALAFLAAIAAVLMFVRRNEGHIEKVARQQDREALKRIVFGKGRGTPK